jgi:hypothetical protein
VTTGAIIALLAATAPTGPIALQCVGIENAFSQGNIKWSKPLLIDLSKKSFCFGNCRMDEKVSSISGSRVTLWDRGADGLKSDGSAVKDVATWDMATGAFNRDYSWNGRMHHAGTVRAVCQPITDSNQVKH